LTDGQAQTSEVFKEEKLLKPNEANNDTDLQWISSPGPNDQQAAPD